MAKRIRVSADGGTTYYTLPGNSGDLKVEMASIDDTIFGQDFQSESPSIGSWSVSASAFFKGVAGYTAALKVGGTPVAVTGEATAQIGTTKSYRIVAAARRLMSYAATVTVKDGVTPVATSSILNIDYLNGIVTFVAGYTPAGAVTIDYSYVPSTALGKGRSFNLKQSAAEIDTTDYATAKANGGWRTYKLGLKTVGLEIGNVWDTATNFITTLQSRGLTYIDVSPDDTQGNAATEVLFRGFFKYMSQNQQGNVGALEEETLSLNLFVPSSELLKAPFTWTFGGAPAIAPAVQVCLQAWENSSLVKVQYSADGVATRTGDAIVTEASLQNSFEGQNEFSFNFRGTGVLTSA